MFYIYFINIFNGYFIFNINYSNSCSKIYNFYYSYNFNFIIKSSIDFKNKNIIFLFLFLLCTINISFNYDERHIKKPNTVQALRLIEKHSEKDILVLPTTVLFQNYISTVPQTKNLNFFEF